MAVITLSRMNCRWPNERLVRLDGVAIGRILIETGRVQASSAFVVGHKQSNLSEHPTQRAAMRWLAEQAEDGGRRISWF